MTITNGEYTVNSFDQDYQADLRPEDPNLDYSLGHFLPFPLAAVEITNLNQGFVKMRFIESNSFLLPRINR
jgi:hypothetical protein